MARSMCRHAGLVIAAAFSLAACDGDLSQALFSSSPSITPVVSATSSPGASSSSPLLDRPNVTTALKDAAATAEAQNDPSSAATYYRNLYAHNPDDTLAALGLIRSLREMGDLAHAQETAEKALAAKPQDPALLAEAGKVRLSAGQLPEAADLLKRAAERDPRDWKSRSALGIVYDRQGAFERADEAYQTALAIVPDNATVLNNFALSRAMAHDLAGARELLQRAVASGTANLRVRQNLALVYALGGDLAAAEALAQRDLPPDLARTTLAYYRELSAAAAAQQVSH